jgi:hypothetical protein
MMRPAIFRYFKTSPEVIRIAVMLYVRFPLSLRNVEDLARTSAASTSRMKQCGAGGAGSPAWPSASAVRSHVYGSVGIGSVRSLHGWR